jgi:hypothetical protein
MTVVIENFVPVPSNREKLQRTNWDNLREKLPFNWMAVGSSFAIHPRDFATDQLRLQNYLSGAACSYRKDNDGWDFTTRQMPDGTVRVWRTA